LIADLCCPSVAGMPDQYSPRGASFPGTAPSEYLSRIVELAEAQLAPKQPSHLELEFGKVYADAIGIGRLSALDWLVGEHLPKIHEKYIGPVARRGEYVRFALKQLAKWGIRGPNNKPYKRETIVRAMSFAARGRRKTGKPN
jgi:hypothetical protein